MPLRRRDPALAAAQRTVREAFEDLEKTVSPADSKDFEATTLENVRKAALEIENQLAARQSLRNMRRLMPLFSGLDYYSRTIEVLCNGTPYLSLIWAPIKLILKISSDYVDAFEQIVKAYARIGESLKRFKVLSETFRQNTEFQQTLAVFYADILRFHKEAYKFVRRSAWKVFFLTSWGRFQRRFDNILEDLARHGQQIDAEANACNIAEARNMRKALEEWRQESLSKVEKDEEEQTARQLEAICSWLKKHETDQLLIFDRISTEGSNHSGTCSWVLGHPKLSKWLRADQSDITCLWLQGNPGTGKSIITGQLVKFLNASYKSLVVSHFCTYSYASSTQYDEILKSLLFQLVRTSSDVAAHIYGGYVIERKTMSMSVLEQLLQTAITALVEDLGRQQTIHMIIDGLDEVEVDKQRRLINLMNGILKSQPLHGATFKVLLSSRRSPLLEKVLRKKPTVSLSDEKDSLEHAIRTYAEQRLNAQSHRLSQLGLEDRDFVDIGKSIAKKADGMFLWARLVLDYLTHNIFYSSDEIWDAINTLPRKLAEFYERVLVQIMSNFNPRSVARMTSIFGWIAFSERPLRKFELRSALSFSTGDPMVDEPVPLYIFDMGMPLIEERLDSTLTFIHVSVKDYLQMPESKLPVVREKQIYEHALASTACLLSGLEVFNIGFSDHERTMRVLKGFHGFHVYANEYWVDYVLDVLSTGHHQAQLFNLPTMLQRLSDTLERLGGLSLVSNKASELVLSDKRLDLLKEYTGLFKNAKITLQARSQKIFGSVPDKEESPTTDLHPVHELKDALANYQTTIRSLLSLRHFPGISVEELERFQREYCTTVFTCRLSSCPRATIGFENDNLRLEHESTHTLRLPCLFPGCQYPPFTSARLLKSHEAKFHATACGRKRIRKIDSQINLQMASNAGSGTGTPASGSQRNGMDQSLGSDVIKDLESISATSSNTTNPSIHKSDGRSGEDNRAAYRLTPPRQRQALVEAAQANGGPLPQTPQNVISNQLRYQQLYTQRLRIMRQDMEKRLHAQYGPPQQYPPHVAQQYGPGLEKTVKAWVLEVMRRDREAMQQRASAGHPDLNKGSSKDAVAYGTVANKRRLSLGTTAAQHDSSPEDPGYRAEDMDQRSPIPLVQYNHSIDTDNLLEASQYAPNSSSLLLGETKIPQMREEQQQLRQDHGGGIPVSLPAGTQGISQTEHFQQPMPPLPPNLLQQQQQFLAMQGQAQAAAQAVQAQANNQQGQQISQQRAARSTTPEPQQGPAAPFGSVASSQQSDTPFIPKSDISTHSDEFQKSMPELSVDRLHSSFVSPNILLINYDQDERYKSIDKLGATMPPTTLENQQSDSLSGMPNVPTPDLSNTRPESKVSFIDGTSLELNSKGLEGQPDWLEWEESLLMKDDDDDDITYGDAFSTEEF